MRPRTLILHYLATAAIATPAGYLGGAIHSLTGSAVVRAERFEVVTSWGRLVSSWGPEMITRFPRRDPAQQTTLVFFDRKKNRRCQLGLGPDDDNPELLLYGAMAARDPRCTLHLGDFDDPELFMTGRHSNGIFLGRFRAPGSGPRGSDENIWAISISGGPTAKARMMGYTDYRGRDTADITVTNQDQSWRLPPAKASRN